MSLSNKGFMLRPQLNVECCMKQYDILQEEVCKLVHKEIEHFWKHINEVCLMTKNIPNPVLDSILSLACIIEFIYANFEDQYTRRIIERLIALTCILVF
ncbi:hypothetical protein Ahy_A08g040061 [Arachis hypogaea]|uniref:Terpene synthase metal-binding domain-containing protein n=1 Tax=Arachis hypogaea TaxID=3818 RepID=A0A445BY36_ARAHY|nr:hypothetical protein Ahy_A08g040061 [Arachis hypogaea]